MLRLTKDSPIDMYKYLEHLSYLGYIYYDMNELDYTSRKNTQELGTLKYLIVQLMKECSGGVVQDDSRYSIIQFLTKHQGVPDSFLIDRKTGDYSIAQKKLTKIYERGYAREFINLYSDFSSKRSKAGLLNSAVSACKESDKVDYSGKPLYKVTHNINENGTLRTYYRDFNHQQLSKDALRAMKAPAGYTLVKGDFAQSDLKIVYNMMLKDPSNLDIMYNYPDSYEGISRVVEGPMFNKEKFLEERHLYKQNTLAPIYGAESSESFEGQRIVNNINDYLKTLSVYSEFKKRIEKRIETGLPVYVRTYFGNEVPIDSTNRSPKDVMHAALNAPVQTGTSEIVIACANAIMDKFAENGITEENGGIYLYLNRHDELIFMINNDYVNYSWIFQECEDILVDDWMPLKIEFSYSDNYIVPNDNLDRLCKSSYKRKEPINISELITKAKSSEFFIPCDDTLRLALGCVVGKDKSVVSLLNVDKNTYKVMDIDTTDLNEIVKYVLLKIGGKKAELLKDDVTSVIVYTDLVLQDVSFNAGLPVLFKTKFNDSMYRQAKMLADKRLKELESI